MASSFSALATILRSNLNTVLNAELLSDEKIYSSRRYIS